MKTSILTYILIVFCSLKVSAQSLPQVPAPVTSINGSVEGICFDSIGKIMYTGGDFTTLGGVTRQNLAAFDITTGNILSWAPVTNGPVYVIIKNGNTIYVGGLFSTVNGVQRDNFAALDLSGNLLPWAPSFDNAVRSFFINGSTLYVGGEFSFIDGFYRERIASFNLQGNSLTSWSPVIPAFDYVDKIRVVSNEVVALYIQFGTPIFSELFIISSLNGTVIDELNPSNPILDFFERGNEILVAGAFTNIVLNSGIVYKNYMVVYNMDSLGITSQNYNPPNYPSTIVNFNDTLYMTDNASFNNCDAFNKCAVTMFPQQINLVTSNYFKKSFVANGRLFFLQSTSQCVNAPTDYQVGSLCLPPPPPIFSSGDSSVCRGELNVPYSLLVQPYHTNFFWTYSGSGVAINGSGNTVTLNFSQSATNGNLNVYAVTDYNYNTPVASFPITMLPSVVADGGANKILTCDSTQVSLTASLTDPNLSFSWLLANGTTSSTQTVFADTVGFYIMTATNSVTTCFNSDTVYVGVDTLKPVINAFTGNYELTCLIDTLVINGSTANISDSLWWIHQGGGVFSNPDTIVVPGTFLFKAKNNSNGCTDTLSIIVVNNSVPPTLTMPLMDSLLFALDLITCDTNFVLLDAVCSSNSVLFWDISATPQNDSLSDPIIVFSSGQFNCYVVDTINGCTNSGIIFTQVDTTKPALNVPFDSTYITCSYNSATLDASSITPSLNLNWYGPSSFTSADPAFVTQTGWYYIFAQKISNGCVSSDSVFVGLDSTLDISCGNDTTICNGSFANFNVTVVGGAAQFSYLWSDGSTGSIGSFNPTDTTSYVLILTDQNNCIGRDTVTINVPDLINDSALTYKPCDAGNPNGQITVYAYGGVAPYQYSIDNGTIFQSSSAFTGLNYGDYAIIIRDTLGCTKSDSISINQQSLSIQAEFLVASTGFSDSVIVLVDISDPRPDSVWWEIPSLATLTGPDSSGTQYHLELPDTGSYPVVMHAAFGQCEDTDTAIIDFVQWDTTYAVINDGLIDSVNVYPNPAPGGQFTVYIKLNKKQIFSIHVYNSSGASPVFTQSVLKDDFFNNVINLPNPSPGTYVIRVVAEYDSRYIILIIP